ncbi:hypothetical protein FH972_023311 [Carpinus fangiana]|uniref:LisH domain-containing protein n=1 Tax=Carpinus fangiana TaxID=176857 RepID=A0A5N6KV89_9ROSI|nr:hypothetical protein FH972_023311 [Carpinus fangiana]
MATDAVRLLQTDHINYLIWRYLQEHGYGHTAVQLQRDWRNDPQALPFASSVEPHTLMSAIQDALAYDELSHGLALDRAHTTGATLPGRSKRYAFIGENQRKRRASPTDDRAESSRPASSHQNDGARKRPRLDVNGVKGSGTSVSGRRKSNKNIHPSTAAGQDAMDVDRRNSSRSEALGEEEEEMPVKEEPPPPPSTLELGRSVPVQCDPIIDTTIAKTLSTFSIPHADIIHATWDPTSAELLTVSGGSVFRTYSIPTESRDEDDIAEPAYENVTEAAGSFFVTARSQNEKRWAYALRVESGVHQCSVHVILEDGERRLLSTPNDLTMFLRWNPSGTLLLGSSVARGDDQGLLYIWDVDSDNDSSPVRIKTPALDGLWLDDSTLLVSGDSMLDIYDVADGEVKRRARINTDRLWDSVRFDKESNRLACLSSGECLLGVLNLHNDQLQTRMAHEESITAIEWQPKPSTGDTSERLLATASFDGNVKLWTTSEVLECVHTFRLEPSVPVSALAFSRDGTLLAAAGEDRVQAWQARPSGERVAHWIDPKAEQDEADPMEIANGNAETDLPMYVLAWNNSSENIAYTRGDSVALIAMPPR